MWIEVNNLHAKLAKATPEEKEWLSEYLSFPDEKAKFRKGPVWKRGDGKIRMMSEFTLNFPAGFVEQVKKAAIEDGYQCQVLDRRRAPVKADPRALIDWLRVYQHEAIAVARTKERGIFWHATGAGKTELMVALAEVFPTTWLILTHSKSLLANTSDRFLKRTGEVIGVIGEGRFQPKRVTVATFQSIYAGIAAKKSGLLKYLETVRGVMVDEVHVTPADTYWRVLMRLENAYFRYGFSGTPFARGDKKSVFTWGAIGPIIHKIAPKMLIDAGVLAQPEIRMAVFKHAPNACSGWSEAYERMIASNVLRNDVVLKQVAVATKPCLLFVNHVAHGRYLESALAQRGARVEFVWGKHGTPMRRAAIERLVNGEVDTLICNVIFQEGIDIPELQSVIIAQGGKSIIAALQRVGRGMRRHDSTGAVTKTSFKVYDIRDRGCGCKPPKHHLGCKWMEKHARGRIGSYTSVGYPVVEETI